jgi:hypothetical protein
MVTAVSPAISCVSRVSRYVDRHDRELDPLVATRAITGMISFRWTWAHRLEPEAERRLVDQMSRIAMRTLEADQH